MEKKVIKNNSKGYGYNYASLADIVNQGYDLPKMKTGTEDGREYVYYKDGEEWIRGAEVVVPEGKMNKAQLYGSALTYARRYTTLMALQLASDDDVTVENLNPNGTKKMSKPTSKADLCIAIEKLYTEAEVVKLLNYYKKTSLSELDEEILNKYFDDRSGKVNNQ